MTQRILFACALLAATSASADFGQYQSHTLEGPSLVIVSDLGELRITPVDEAAFEVHYVEDGVKQLPSFAIDRHNTGDVISAVSDSESALAFMIDGLTAVIDKSPVRVRFMKDGEPLVAEEHGYFAYDTVRGFRFQLDAGEKILGGGQRVMGMDRRGRRMPLYNKASYGYETDAEQMYYSLPAIMSSDKYTIVFDNSASGWLDIGSTESDVLQFEAVGGRTAYIVIAGDSYPQLINNYTDVTGKQPLPPRWAFGNFASRFGYRSEKEARDVVRRFQRADIPLDAIILDIYWFGPDIKGHMGRLDWDREAWPTPEDMISDFADDGVKTIAITEPFILSTSDRWDDAVSSRALARTPTGEPRRFDFYFGNTGLVDVFDETARKWFWQPYEMLFEQGAAATWGDLGEPEVHPGDALHWLSDSGQEATGDEIHNAYGHEWARMVYERQVAKYPDMRPLILMRSGFAGSQRFGMLPWTGDVSRSWGGFKPQIELSLQMGMFGLAYNHSDLGGFAGGETFDKEMYIRWLQYGVFQPVYRPHAQEHIAAEPVFHDRQTRRIIRDYIKLRYRLLPYVYTMAYENSTSGMPLMRPLFFEDESDKSLIDEKDSYLWGDAFFVAPVMDPGLRSVSVDLPAGTWFDFWTDTRYDGAQEVDIPVTLETIPVLVRAGSFIPMTPDIPTTRDYSSEQLTLHYYADSTVPSATGQMYEDDGKSRTSLDDGAYELLRFNAEQQGDALTIELGREGSDYSGRPTLRDMTIVIHNWNAEVSSLQLGDAAIPIARSMPKTGSAAVFDRQRSTLTVRFAWNHAATTLFINDDQRAAKAVVYQVFTRLFGNKDTTNKPWGTIEENGVGKFSDFDDKALEGIRELGTTHVWYTGVPHHAVIRDYSEFGIGHDDPDVVKGRAGSPYAVKDYYNVNPDLADDPANRLAEFEALIERTHAHGMKVLIDIVPNHVARGYHSLSRPGGVEDFGASDDTSVEWARDNNFYYVPAEDFAVPEPPAGYRPLGGDPHPLADGEFEESPAKWTGNGSRAAQPRFDDWFETVKVNYGVRPDGSYAFDQLPDTARTWSIAQHAAFWADRDVPDSWIKFRQIVSYWLDKGVDGFRYDMAEMVPVEFWSYLNSSIKMKNGDAFLLAEVYNPQEYRNYLQLGRMDYLYDKVGFYDTLKPIMQGKASTDTLAPAHADVLDIEQHMLHFLENHDEQRIASPGFAGDARKGKPAMVVSALISRSPTMLYFAQDVGESGEGDAGFGDPTRTTIFDYWGVPSHQRWMNGGAFDGGGLSEGEKALRDFYTRLMRFSASNRALSGDYAEIHSYNRSRADAAYNEKVFSFVRWQGDERLLVVSNFDDASAYDLEIHVPADVIREWRLADGRYMLDEQLYRRNHAQLIVDRGEAKFRVSLPALESVVLKVGAPNISGSADVNYN
ncbi:MAG: TIM-barrel domain-containing protein [Woeseiaceae bacterium]